jgi:hypothetical protein
LFANAVWSLVPSLIACRFPMELRSTATSIIYNGGLAIGFASPFISMGFFLYVKNEYLMAIPMILSAFFMIYGTEKLIEFENKNNNKPIKFVILTSIVNIINSKTGLSFYLSITINHIFN